MLSRLLTPLDNFVAAMCGELEKPGRIWGRVGAVVLAVAAAMSFDFGMAVSWKHACFLAGLTFVAAFGPEIACKFWDKGRHISASVLGIGACILLVMQFFVDQSYTAGIRGDNLTTTRVQNVKYTHAQEAVSEDKTNLVMWQKRLADLEAANAWSATVTADALRAKLTSANLAIDLEAKRGGCKAKCLERTKERDGIASQIAIAEEKSDLTRKIEATKAVLAKARDKADTTEHKSSAVAHANTSIARVVSFFGKGEIEASPVIEAGAELSTNLGMALCATVLPAFCFFAAGLYRRPEDDKAKDHKRPDVASIFLGEARMRGMIPA